MKRAGVGSLSQIEINGINYLISSEQILCFSTAFTLLNDFYIDFELNGCDKENWDMSALRAFSSQREPDTPCEISSCML